MISRRTCSVSKEDVLPRLLYCDSRCSQSCCRHYQTCRRHSQALPGAPNVLSAAPRCAQTYHNHSHGTPVAVIGDPSYSEGRQECPPSVWYSPEIDASKITLHILSDTPGVFQWLKYILLMWMSNMIFLCEHTIVIPWIPCRFRMAKAVSPTVELVNSVTSDSVNLFDFAMWAFASKCFPIELVPCSDGWRRTWWQTIPLGGCFDLCNSTFNGVFFGYSS